MSLIWYQTRSDEGCGAFSKNQDRLTMALDDISGKRDSYDFWGVHQRTGRLKRGETAEGRRRCGRRMSRGKWHHSCPKQRTDVEAPFETDGGKDD